MFMKNSAFLKVLLIFMVSLVAMFGFGYAGYLTGNPFRTKAALVAAGVLATVALVASLAKAGPMPWAISALNKLAWLGYAAGAISALYVLGSLAWLRTPWRPNILAWVIILSAILLISHKWRYQFEQEIQQEEENENPVWVGEEPPSESALQTAEA
jgi:hypothetical protein